MHQTRCVLDSSMSTVKEKFSTIFVNFLSHPDDPWYIYLQNWISYGVNVSKYTSTMDHLGHGLKIPLETLTLRHPKLGPPEEKMTSDQS